jgi:GNAT superfamily N-acetyltransferase
MNIRRLHAPTPTELEALTDVLQDCVEGGASVNFMLPVQRTKLRGFWQTVADGVAQGERALLVAEDEHGIAGTVQLVLAQPDNQPHRADLAKMLVHRRARRQGMGDALMKAAEQTALACGKTLLVLDTASEEAERLYERHGWVRLGSIPDYALWPQGGWCPATIYYRHLAPPGSQLA